MPSGILYSGKHLGIVMKYRSRTDITSQILETASHGGITKTKIMYNAYLSYAQLKEYLSVLLENGLVEYVEGDKVFRTTSKGMQFLKTYSQIGDMLTAAPAAIKK
jgi:predicted transcriptional regulator